MPEGDWLTQILIIPARCYEEQTMQRNVNRDMKKATGSEPIIGNDGQPSLTPAEVDALVAPGIGNVAELITIEPKKPAPIVPSTDELQDQAFRDQIARDYAADSEQRHLTSMAPFEMPWSRQTLKIEWATFWSHVCRFQERMDGAAGIFKRGGRGSIESAHAEAVRAKAEFKTFCEANFIPLKWD